MSLPFLEELRSTTSTNKKQEILEKYKNDENVKKILFYTYNPLYNYYVKKFKKKSKDQVLYDLNDIFKILDYLRNRDVTGNSAIAMVEDLYEHLDDDYREILELILKRDLKAGINVKLINKVFDNLIPLTPYMGAIAYNEKKVKKLFKDAKEVWAEVKYDGMFINIIKENGKILTLSRNGKDLALESVFEHRVKGDNLVITGELLVKGFNRYIANGMLNSYSTIKRKLKESSNKSEKKLLKDIEEFEKRYDIGFDRVDNLIYVKAWDLIPLNDWKKGRCEIPLKERRKTLRGLLNDKIEEVEYKIVENEYEAKQEFKRQKEKGEEGIILKDADGIFKDGKPNYQIKYKVIMDVDMRITGFEYGNAGTKYESVINRVICESEDGIVKSQVSGLSENDMKYITEHKDELIGKIATIECSGLSSNKNGEYSLLHPRFVEIRFDKNEADSFEKIKEIEKAAYELNK